MIMFDYTSKLSAKQGFSEGDPVGGK